MTKKVLIVDDSATARALLKVCFSGYPELDIYCAKNGEEALEQAKKINPFLIILDYNMPEKTGTEIAKMLQDSGLTGSYVLVTANTQQSVLNETKALNFFDVIEKPVSAEKVQALLEKLL